jgi:hypothetical protein
MVTAYRAPSSFDFFASLLKLEQLVLFLLVMRENHGTGRILIMSKSGFEDEVLIKLIVGVVKHVTIDELGPVDYRGSNRFL